MEDKEEIVEIEELVKVVEVEEIVWIRETVVEVEEELMRVEGQ